ncbi:hypothetical protein [Hydrogenothermus marinus]|uniref:Uncharacterized protein n=1 Tax=Hydrogenothermus marinus TaxID=133270 RepID=A0A3M0B6Z5_9AQUI|nr:hypothetical protein [Hydrogenothermus marinus]RMA93133.1 hypothetical protein CLV39_1466 [Hydrogenothermus marinus]
MYEKRLQENPFMTNSKFLQEFKEETELDRILKFLTVPGRSGIYISRIEIQKLAKAIGVDVPVKERREMLKDIFIYAKQMNKTIDLLNTIIDFIDYKISQYKEVEDNFPSSKVITERWIKKAEKAKAIVENMRKEAELLKDIY